MKKCLSAAVLILSALGLFTSCKDEKSTNLTPLTVWFGPSSSDSPPPLKDWFVLDIVKRDLGIDLKVVPLPQSQQDQIEKIETAVKTNTLPDLFMVQQEELVSLVKRNLVARVDPMFKMMPERTAQMYDEQAKKVSSFDGICYGLSQAGSIAKNEGVLIRKDWLDKLGKDVPVTTEDYIEIMRAFTNDDPDGNGKNDTWGFGAFVEITPTEEGLGRRFMPFFGAYGVAGTFDTRKASAGLMIHKPEYYQALSYIRQIVAEKLIDPNWSAYGKDDFRNAWKSGRFGIMREQNAAYGLERGYKPFDENFPEGQWIVIDPPTGPNGDCSVGNYIQGYRTYAVSKRSAELGKLPAIAKFLEWMSTDGYYYIAYGKENENYMFDANGNVTTEGLPDPNLAYSKDAAAVLIQMRNMVFYNSDAELISRYPTWTSINGKKISALLTLREMQQKPWTPNLGAELLPVPEKDLKDYLEQGVMDFVEGKRDLSQESWKDWLAEFDRRGGLQWEKDCIDYARENNILTDD